jgi:hypothetical protein
MKEILEVIIGGTLYLAGIISGFAHFYEFHTLSDKYAKKMAKKNMMDEYGQYYFDFMKDYL